MHHLRDFRAGILIVDVLNVFKKLNLDRKVSGGDKLLFFKALDSTYNGSIDYIELLTFYIEYF